MAVAFVAANTDAAVASAMAAPAVDAAIPAVVTAAAASNPTAPIDIPNPITDASDANPEISGIFKLLTLLVRSLISFYKVMLLLFKVSVAAYRPVISVWVNKFQAY